MSEQYPTPTPASTDTPSATVCVNHPGRTTMLRCNRCGDPICPECAVLTPTGYRCKKCVRGLQRNFETARWWDYPLAILTAGVLSGVGSLIVGMIGFFTIFLAPIAGMIIAEGVRWVIRKRRSKTLFIVATVAAVAGALPLLLLRLLGGSLIGVLWPAIYTFLIASTVYYRLSGIQIGR